MSRHFTIAGATPDDVPDVATMAGELLEEIMQVTGERSFRFDLAATTARLADFIAHGRYSVFVARAEPGAVGFVALYESQSLYAGGAFGTIPELFVRPAFRCAGVGRDLLDHAKAFAGQRGWTGLEVTTPALPWFDRTLAFYRREGFAIAGGRKLKLEL